MSRRRSRRRPSSVFEIIPPLVGLVLLGVFFVPGFKEGLSSLLAVVAVLFALVVAGLLAWKFLRKPPSDPSLVAAGAGSKPPLVSASEAWQRMERTGSGTMPVAAPPPVWRASWSRALLSELEWKRFEDVVAAYVRELGFEARTTRIGADGGVDVEVVDPQTGRVGSLIQCKAWDAYKVGIKPVRELFGVMAAAGIKEGAFFTSGEFTSEAREFARQNRLDLVDGDEFLSRICQLPPEAAERLLSLATEGDYTTPTCPNCGIKMVRRTAGKGRSEGSDFWGCPRYPRCKQTFRIAS